MDRQTSSGWETTVLSLSTSKWRHKQVPSHSFQTNRLPRSLLLAHIITVRQCKSFSLIEILELKLNFQKIFESCLH